MRPLGCWIQMWYRQEQEHDLDRLKKNTMVHNHRAAYLPGTCSCSYPQQTPDDQGLSSLGPEPPQTWCQHSISGERFLQQFIPWMRLGSSTSNQKWRTIETAETPRVSHERLFYKVCRWDDDLLFLGCKGSAVGGLPGKRSHCNRGQLRWWQLQVQTTNYYKDRICTLEYIYLD